MVTIGGIPVFDALITDEESGMMKISLVDDPAVMSDFLAFDNHRKMQMYSVTDAERRLVRGVVMRADFPIYRRDDRLGEYYIIYKPETIRLMAEKYLAESRQNDVNVMHSTDVDGVQMVQWFIKGDGVSVNGFDDIADGSLFAEFHIVNDKVWEAVKEGTYKGFSLEGYFDLAPEENIKEMEEIVEDLDGKFERIIKKSIINITMSKTKYSRFRAALAKLLAVFGNVTTDKGVLAWDGEEDLKAGDAVFIEDQEGNRTDAPDGDYITSDNKTIVVVDGKVSEIKDPEAEVAPEEPAEEPAEETYGSVVTDKYLLEWPGEEDLKEGDEVFIREAEEGLVPAPDGEYKTEDGKTIVVVDGKVAEIRDAEAEVEPEEAPAEPSAEEELRKENAELRSQVETLSKKVEELSRMPLAEPAHEEAKASGSVTKTGIKGLDRIAELMSK